MEVVILNSLNMNEKNTGSIPDYTYSGMMSCEKAVRELPYLGFMFEMPIVVMGVG